MEAVPSCPKYNGVVFKFGLFDVILWIIEISVLELDVVFLSDAFNDVNNENSAFMVH
jgi:hypothetical protein